MLISQNSKGHVKLELRHEVDVQAKDIQETVAAKHKPLNSTNSVFVCIMTEFYDHYFPEIADSVLDDADDL